MAVATFDTLKFANTLKAAGVPAQQAEAQAVAFGEVIQINFKDLATKEDLAVTAKDLRHEIKETEQRLSARIDLVVADLKALRTELKAEMQHLKWMMGVGITIGIAVLVRLFFFHTPI